MSKVKIWKCDICLTEFREGDASWLANSSLEFSIPSSTMYDKTRNYKFDDICVECKSGLSSAIDDFIDKKRGKNE